jgi:hypothetical protein
MVTPFFSERPGTFHMRLNGHPDEWSRLRLGLGTIVLPEGLFST